MPDARFIVQGGHRTWLKWHRARRCGTDPVFTGRRILEGMALGASVEVDLVVHADAGFAVLHDLTLDAETTGSGPVASTSADALRALNLRDNIGQALDDKVMLLEDLASLLVRDGAHPESLLQLDYKQDAAALSERVVAGFATAIGPVSNHFILSSGDARSVAILGDAVPGLRIGFDPCHDDAVARLRQTGDFSGFVDATIAASPLAELIYLACPLVLAADARGIDLIDAFHRQGRRVDAYTIRRPDPGGVTAANRLIALKVDQITTDDPEGMEAALPDES